MCCSYGAACPSLADGSFHELRLEGNRVSVEYVVQEESHEQAYELGYMLFRRNGATCGIAAIERFPFDPANGTIAALDGIRVTPGLEIVGAVGSRATARTAVSFNACVLARMCRVSAWMARASSREGSGVRRG
jgi:hypothetical protein